MEESTCENCIFWTTNENEQDPNGLCKALPPAPGKTGEARWGKARNDEWCGAHETK